MEGNKNTFNFKIQNKGILVVYFPVKKANLSKLMFT